MNQKTKERIKLWSEIIPDTFIKIYKQQKEMVENGTIKIENKDHIRIKKGLPKTEKEISERIYEREGRILELIKEEFVLEKTHKTIEGMLSEEKEKTILNTLAGCWDFQKRAGHKETDSIILYSPPERATMSPVKTIFNSVKELKTLMKEMPKSKRIACVIITNSNNTTLYEKGEWIKTRKENV